MKHIKSNAPLLLLVSIVPYLFYTDPTLPQAIIASSLAALAGFKIYLEHNTLPDYKKLFEDDIHTRDEAIKDKIHELLLEVQQVREKQGVLNIGEAKKIQRDSVSW